METGTIADCRLPDGDGRWFAGRTSGSCVKGKQRIACPCDLLNRPHSGFAIAIPWA